MAESLSRTPQETVKVSSKASFLANVAADRVPGISHRLRTGRVTTVVGSTEYPFWAESGSTYPWPSTAQALTLSSSDAADTAVVIRITELLDASFVPQPDVTLTLNGQTPVAVGSYYRCGRAYVVSGTLAGTAYVGYGTVTTGKPASVLVSVLPVYNDTLQMITTTPANTSFLIRNLYFNSSARITTILVKVRNPTTGVVRTLGELVVNGGNYINVQTTFSFVVPEKTDFLITANSTLGSAPLTAWADIYSISTL